jgi:Tat protein secretion system quality control protein TatD with DNase activity
MATSNAHDDGGPFPWELGVFDAHCHPTETMTSIGDIPHMKTAALTAMASREEDQELVSQVASQLGVGTAGNKPSDQAASPGVIPCFGWHPWFAHQIVDDVNHPGAANNQAAAAVAKIAHYKSVLTPPSSQEGEDEGFFLALSDPKPLSSMIAETRARLIAHPQALVGEVGLDRAFRLPSAWLPHEIEARDPSLTPGSRGGRKLSAYRVQISHQKAVLKAQLQLAGELHRAVSIHSVQAHGTVIELLQELWAGHERLSHRERKRRRSVANAHQGCESEEQSQTPSTSQSTTSTSFRPLPFPPRICMHSYSGPAEPLKQFLHPSVPSDIYFSFSSLVNFSTQSSGKAIDVIRTVPKDRLLVESDGHCAGPQMDALLEEIVRKVCSLHGWTLDHGVRQLAENWHRFVFG